MSKKSCAYLCPSHLDHCILQTNDSGGSHDGDCKCHRATCELERDSWMAKHGWLPVAEKDIN